MKVPSSTDNSEQSGVNIAEFKFADVIESWINDQSITKAERTRLRLLKGTCHSLNSNTFLQLRVAEICKTASVSYGVFYNYFKDKNELVVELIEKFMKEFFHRFEEINPTGDDYWDVFWPVCFYVHSYKNNYGLMRVIVANLDELPQLEASAKLFANNWHARIAQLIPETIAGRRLSQTDRLLVAHMTGAQLDGVLQQIYFSRNDAIVDYAEKKNEIIELNSIIRYRTIFGADPGPESITSARATLARFSD